MGYLKAFPRRSLWIVILCASLYVSGWSLFSVARHMGVPLYVAVCSSACFDGVALLAGIYSIQAVKDERSDYWARTIVLTFAGISAYINSLHAKIGHEMNGAWLFWAILPIGAVVAHSLATQKERQKARARQGKRYPAPLPKWGLSAWLLFPLVTLDGLRGIVGARFIALALTHGWFPRKNRSGKWVPAGIADLLNASDAVPAVAGNGARRPIKAASPPLSAPNAPANGAPAPANGAPAPANAEAANANGAKANANAEPNAQRPANGANADAGRPNVVRLFGNASPKEIRTWAKEHGWPDLGTHGRMPVEAIEAYYEANRDSNASGG